MRIYNYLFYKTYLLAKQSGNFDDTPVLGGIVFVAGCLGFNLMSILFVIEGSWMVIFTPNDNKLYKYVFGFSLLGLVWGYYSYNKRYEKIIEKYEKKNRGGFELHPIWVIIIYFGLTIFLLFLSAFYLHHDWIFAE